ncbi:hypothetical protein ACUSIJ_06635 [Pseudochelatococcus sp. B33]
MARHEMVRTAGLIGATAGALLLGGCLSSAEIAQLNAEQDIERCTGYGFKPGTEAFAKCRFDLDQRRDAERDALLASTAWGGFYALPPGPCWHSRWGLRCDPW